MQLIACELLLLQQWKESQANPLRPKTWETEESKKQWDRWWEQLRIRIRKCASRHQRYASQDWCCSRATDARHGWYVEQQKKREDKPVGKWYLFMRKIISKDLEQRICHAVPFQSINQPCFSRSEKSTVHPDVFLGNNAESMMLSNLLSLNGNAFSKRACSGLEQVHYQWVKAVVLISTSSLVPEQSCKEMLTNGFRRWQRNTCFWSVTFNWKHANR